LGQYITTPDGSYSVYLYDDEDVWYFTAHTQRATWKLEYTKHTVDDSKGRKCFRVRRYKRTGVFWSWTLKQERFFRVKWKAKDWCWKWYCRYKQRPFQSLHTKSEGRIKAGKKLWRIKKLREDAKKSGLKPVRKRKILRKKIMKEKSE